MQITMSEELGKAAKEYSQNGDYQFMSTFQQMAKKAFIAGANWQARNTIITDNSEVIDNLEKEIERLNSLLNK
jgi:hypothetical protein